MALFQTSVLNNYLKRQNAEAITKAYKKFAKYFLDTTIQQNIRESKEEQFQEGFLRELFVTVLGYMLNPHANFDLTTELKNEKGAKKADGAILKNGNALGVIELKSTKTKDLESIRQQAFDYKANQTNCVYVVTSNFEKLRFYVNNAVEFEEFDLFTLNQERFALLYLCLEKENLLQNIPLKIKEESIQVEEQITKKFYGDYSLFKRELYRDLVKLNIKNEVFRVEFNKEDTERANKNIKQNLFKKSQKLIDRFLFIFFAEDRNLLPPNSTIKILEQWDKLKELDAYAPLYDRFKLYFNFLDTGRKGTDKTAEIFAYNGGLFKPDAVLDSLLISDELLYKHTNILSIYDFQSQVDVNILGHIFENSLNEIESVNAEIEGVEFDAQKTKRKKDGVFYTPKYITKYIVESTVGKLCTEKKAELEINEEEYNKSRKGRTTAKLKELKDQLDNYRNWLLQLTICDPACGSGAFLNQALDFLIKEHQYIDELQTSLLGGGLVFPDIENTVLENNIFGVDLNEESVEIAKLSLWLRTAQPRRKLNDLNNNIKCGNSLIDSKAVAGDKAFKWQDEFPHVFKEKEKKAFHITTATHDSRTSQRMVDYKVRELRDNGLNPKAQPIWLELEDELLITKTVAEIVKEDELNVMAFNSCGDHMHLLLVCEEEEVTKIVGKIKGKTSRIYNSNKGINPLVQKGEEKSVPLWTQKFGCKEITDEKQLWNTVEYIKNNRIKHELPPLHSNKGINKGINPLIEIENELFYCSYEHAFRTEYKGGFDVVIGNPPYVRRTELPDEIKNYIEKNYYSAYKQYDLYILFNELALKIVKTQSYIGLIQPNKFLSAEYGYKISNLLINNSEIISIYNVSLDKIFEDASVYPYIFIYKKTGFNFDFDNQKVNLLESCKPDGLLGFDTILNSKNIIDKILTNSINLGSLVSKVKRGVPNSKIDFDVQGKFKGIKSTLLNLPYYQPKPQEFFNYLSEIDEKNKIIEFSNYLIMMPRTILRLRAMLKDNSSHILDRIYYFEVLEEEYLLDFLIAILNSKLSTFYYDYEYGSTKIGGGYIDLKGSQIINFKIPKASKEKQEQLKIYSNELAQLYCNYENCSTKFNSYLQSQFSIEKLSTKLQNWHELSFADFIKELNKAIKTAKGTPLTKLQEMEWMEVFETKKADAQTLKVEIEKTDKEIDNMVYELYGLSEEEIKIVEGS